MTVTSSKITAHYKKAFITIDKHSKDLEECIFINLNNQEDLKKFINEVGLNRRY